MTGYINFFKEFIEKGGPSESERTLIDKQIQSLSNYIQDNKLSDAEKDDFNAFFGKNFPSETMYGLSFHKPHGYPGDFEIIDKIFTYYISPKPEYKNWDIYYQERGSARAVRKRKECFKKLLFEKIQEYSGKLKVLNVASGPCRDLLEFFEENPNANIHVTCLEHDINAINYAKELLKDHLSKVSFLHSNIFKVKLEDKYDVVWSSGIYDYFNDQTFVFITKKIIKNCNENAEIAIGNFAKTSPDKYIMHIVGWKLHYRSPEDLVKLAESCGIKPFNTDVYVGDEKVSLIFYMKL